MPRAADGGFGGKISQVNHQIIGDFDQHGICPYGGNRARHRGQRKAVGQDSVAGLHATGPQGNLHGLTARCQRQTIARALPRSILALQCHRFGFLCGRDVISVQPTRLQHGHSSRDTGRWNRGLLRKAAGKAGVGHLSLHLVKAQF